MKSAEVFAFPSEHEGTPNVVLEAMACGCPLVLSDIPEHRDLVDRQGALFVSTGSASQLASAILETFSQRRGAHVRAEYARQSIMRYSTSALVQSYEQIYCNLIHK